MYQSGKEEKRERERERERERDQTRERERERERERVTIHISLAKECNAHVYKQYDYKIYAFWNFGFPPVYWSSL